MTKGRILLVAYYFPPMGGAGVGRPFILARDLPIRGYECDVLTVKNVAYRQYEPELLEELPQTRIYRSRSFDPQRLLYLLGVRQIGKSASVSGGARGWSQRIFPDSKVGWVRPAIKFGRTLATNRSYDAIISTSPPISAHLVARRLAKEFKVPWIADFRDMWTSYRPQDIYDSKSRVDRAMKLLGDIQSEATVVTAVNQPVADFVGGGNVITNCYDAQSVSFSIAPSTESFTICLFGTFDSITPLTPLMKVLSALRTRALKQFSKIRLLQIGNIASSNFHQLLIDFDMREIVELHGFKPRREALELALSGSMFYISLASERERHLTTGRIYYMLASGRPILACVPAGSDVARLIDGYGRGHCFTNAQIDRAADYLAEQIDHWSKGGLCLSPLSDFAKQFSSTAMVGRFVRLIGKSQVRES